VVSQPPKRSVEQMMRVKEFSERLNLDIPHIRDSIKGVDDRARFEVKKTQSDHHKYADNRWGVA